MNFIETLESRRFCSVSHVSITTTTGSDPVDGFIQNINKLSVDNTGRIYFVLKGQGVVYLNLDGTIGKYNPDAQPYDEYALAAYQECADAIRNGTVVLADSNCVHIEGSFLGIQVSDQGWCWNSMH